jgi:hypothetical protein
MKIIQDSKSRVGMHINCSCPNNDCAKSCEIEIYDGGIYEIVCPKCGCIYHVTAHHGGHKTRIIKDPRFKTIKTSDDPECTFKLTDVIINDCKLDGDVCCTAGFVKPRARNENITQIVQVDSGFDSTYVKLRKQWYTYQYAITNYHPYITGYRMPKFRSERRLWAALKPRILYNFNKRYNKYINHCIQACPFLTMIAMMLNGRVELTFEFNAITTGSPQLSIANKLGPIYLSYADSKLCIRIRDLQDCIAVDLCDPNVNLKAITDKIIDIANNLNAPFEPLIAYGRSKTRTCTV